MQDPSGELTITGVVQREAWLQRAMPPAEQLGQDLWSLPVPIPDNPLRYVSVYAFGTGEGLVLIDAGWGAEESWRALRDGLESIGAGVADVRGVLVTHMHFDHVGLAGRVLDAEDLAKRQLFQWHADFCPPRQFAEGTRNCRPRECRPHRGPAHAAARVAVSQYLHLQAWLEILPARANGPRPDH